MTLIDAIQTELAQIPAAPDGTLTLAATNFTEPRIERFFRQSLQTDELTVARAIVTPAEQMVTVTGQATVLGYAELEIDLTFADVENFLDIRLEAVFPAAREITLPAVSWLTLHELGLSLSLTGEFGDTDFQIQGAVRAGAVNIPITLGQVSAAEWQLTIASNGSLPLPDLNHLIDLLGGETIGTFFPQTLVAAIQDIAVSDIGARFDPTAGTVSQFSVQVGATNGWDIAPKVRLQPGMNLRLTLVDPLDSETRLTIGVVTGTITINQTDIPIFVQAGAGGGNTWSVGVLPDNGIQLPGLIDLLDLAGGADLIAAFPHGLQQVPNILLNALTIEFDPVNGLIGRVSFDVSTAAGWPVVADYFTVENLEINLDLENLTDSTQRSIAGSIQSTFAVGETLLLFVLRKKAGDDNWILIGSSLPDQTINLTAIAAALLEGFITIPAEAPDIAFSNVSMTVVPALQTVTFVANSTERWSLLPSFSIDNLNLNFNYTPQNAPNPVSGAIAGVVTIAGLDLSLSAALNNSPGSGWQFEGSTGAGQAIPIGALIDDLAGAFGQITLPAAISDLTIQNLRTSFNTAARDFTFTVEGRLPLDDRDLAAIITIDIVRQADGTYTNRFGGRLMIGGLQFDLLFVQEAASDHFAAVYSHTTAAQALMIHEFIAALSDPVAAYIPADLEIDLKNVVFAYRREATLSQFVVGLDIGTGFNLAQLPLVGEIIAADQTIRVDDLQLIVASTAVTPDQIADFNDLLPGGVTPLPGRMLDEGINLAAMIDFGGSMELLNLPVRGGAAEPPLPAPEPAPPPGAVPVATADAAKWYTLQRSFGPVHFERVGVQYQDSTLLFLLDASLTAAGLTLTLDGLGFGGDLNPFTPTFELAGLGLDYRNGPLEIGGAFLRQTVQLAGGEIVDEYDGAAVISTDALTLSAVGSYSRLEGQPSLFIYAVLDYPLGGPAFFFVTGLAAGFGYNRSLTVPPVGRVADFALVQEAVSVSEGAAPGGLAETLARLRNDVPIDLGQNFLAVGIKFTSFKLIDSFILAAVSFGDRFELDILGLSTLVVPTPLPGDVVTPLAEVQMALKASFIPAEGFLGVSAQLTEASYILSRACHLTGGFAFYAWFSGRNGGDFVQTMGGYHPDFRVPAHYPPVPRLGFNWRVNEELSLKGTAYYALTPGALMAGGHLQATWRSGSLMACFDVGADFLIAWKPYYYTARANADLVVHYTFSIFGVRKRITVDVGADLRMWGPEFSGTAHIRLAVVSFDIRFGGGPRLPQPLDWPTFRASFLPADEADVVSLVVADGLVRELADEADELAGWVVNPKQFTLTTDSIIPAKTSNVTDGVFGQEVGIGAMAIPAGAFTSTHHIVITAANGREIEATYEPIFKDVPAGLWGQQLLPDLNDTALVRGALTGFTIRPANTLTAGTTMPVDRRQLQFSPALAPAYHLTPLIPFTADATLTETARRDALRAELVSDTTTTARTNLLAALGVAAAVDLSPGAADVFVIAPHLSAQGDKSSDE